MILEKLSLNPMVVMGAAEALSGFRGFQWFLCKN